MPYIRDGFDVLASYSEFFLVTTCLAPFYYFIPPIFLSSSLFLLSPPLLLTYNGSSPVFKSLITPAKYHNRRTWHIAIASIFSLFRSAITIFPAAEKALSHSADIAWIMRKSKAILDSREYRSCRSIQYLMGSRMRLSPGFLSSCYCSYSSPFTAVGGDSGCCWSNPKGSS
jgi:hypothetical protein